MKAGKTLDNVKEEVDGIKEAAMDPVNEEAGEDEPADEDEARQDDKKKEDDTEVKEKEKDKTEKALLCQRIVEKGLKQSLMIKENPLCQNLTIGKRGRPKNADKILKEKSKRQKVAEEEQSSVQPTTTNLQGDISQ